MSGTVSSRGESRTDADFIGLSAGKMNATIFLAGHDPSRRRNPRKIGLARRRRARKPAAGGKAPGQPPSSRYIGAWCFLDHYGPDDIKATGGMWVPPHPHTGLQTVTWLFEGLGLHTDSLGSHQLIRPGQLNVMTAGHGICHAEVSPEEAPARLHGVQLWVCLPDEARDTAPPDFPHLAELPTYDEPASPSACSPGRWRGRGRPRRRTRRWSGAEVTLEPGASGCR